MESFNTDTADGVGNFSEALLQTLVKGLDLEIYRDIDTLLKLKIKLFLHFFEKITVQYLLKIVVSNCVYKLFLT